MVFSNAVHLLQSDSDLFISIYSFIGVFSNNPSEIGLAYGGYSSSDEHVFLRSIFNISAKWQDL